MSSLAAEAYSVLSAVQAPAAANSDPGPGPLLRSTECTSGGEAIHTGAVIVTARATGAAHALMTSPLLRRFNDLQATTLMLSGNPTDGGKIRGQRFDRLPPGRAILLTDSDIPTYVQLVNPLVEESVAADGR